MPDEVFEFDGVVEKKFNDFLTLLLIALILFVLETAYHLFNIIADLNTNSEDIYSNKIYPLIILTNFSILVNTTWHCWQCLQLQKIYLTTQDTAYIIPLWVYKKNMALYLFAYTLLHFVVNILYFFIFQVFFKNI